MQPPCFNLLADLGEIQIHKISAGSGKRSKEDDMPRDFGLLGPRPLALVHLCALVGTRGVVRSQVGRIEDICRRFGEAFENSSYFFPKTDYLIDFKISYSECFALAV